MADNQEEDEQQDPDDGDGVKQAKVLRINSVSVDINSFINIV